MNGKFRLHKMASLIIATEPGKCIDSIFLMQNVRCVEKGVLQQYCPWEGKGMGFPLNFGEVYAMRCLNPDSIQGWIKRK